MRARANVVALNRGGSKGPDQVLPRVCFGPDGGAAQIDHKPEQLSPYGWFTILKEEAALVDTPLTQESQDYWRLPARSSRPSSQGAQAPASANIKADCFSNWTVGDTQF